MTGYIASGAVLALAVLFIIKLILVYRTARRQKRAQAALDAEYVRARLRRLGTESTARHRMPDPAPQQEESDAR